MIDNIKFTDGNLSNNPTIYENVADLQNLNFNLIYHRSWFTTEERNSIINARHSEILVRNELPLKGFLKLIAVRSEAEKETFLYQMPTHLRAIYQNKIYIQPRPMIFVNKWLYLDKVFIINNILSIYWHSCVEVSNCSNRYKLTILITNIDTSIQKTLTAKNWYPVDNPTQFRLSKELQNSKLKLSIFIDDILAFKNILAF